MNTFGRTKAMNAVEDSSRSPGRARARGGRTVKVLAPDRIGGSLPPGGGGRDSPRTSIRAPRASVRAAAFASGTGTASGAGAGAGGEAGVGPA
ncbi:hypothetical protein ACFVVA_16945 [Kitasatospora sp. NPDC058048]|uniref:hypothetical protein n=1 Tax=Kitasatospora sp. NPDC058048 TaxID=3346313 RepID=UPI0036D95D08